LPEPAFLEYNDKAALWGLPGKGERQMSAQFVTSPDGIRIAYDVAGSGPALMLLHGAGKTRKDWHKLGYVERLQSDWTVISVDIRGSGESDHLFEISDYAIEKVCADLYAVADACDAREFAVWGFSFGGNIARYLAAWSKRVTALAVIGVPFGPAVDEEFDRYIDEFIEKYGPLAQAYQEGTLNEKGRKTAIKGHILEWIACFQAMREWPSIEPSDIACPTLLVVGTRNKRVLNWVQANKQDLDEAMVQVVIVEGLTHQQEFSKIDQVFPAVSRLSK
jgi:pimeloyl-ACP methyl ester carboxylesterase